jgi:transposase InsO family protein
VLRSSTRRSPSNSSITSWSGSRSAWRSSRPTTEPSSAPASTGRGIGHVYIKPRTPRLNGKVERSHRIDAEEFYRLLDGVVIDDNTKVFNDKLREWEDFYNYHRPHGSLDGQTPYERLRQRTTQV